MSYDNDSDNVIELPIAKGRPPEEGAQAPEAEAPCNCFRCQTKRAGELMPDYVTHPQSARVRALLGFTMPDMPTEESSHEERAAFRVEVQEHESRMAARIARNFTDYERKVLTHDAMAFVYAWGWSATLHIFAELAELYAGNLAECIVDETAAPRHPAMDGMSTEKLNQTMMRMSETLRAAKFVMEHAGDGLKGFFSVVAPAPIDLSQTPPHLWPYKGGPSPVETPAVTPDDDDELAYEQGEEPPAVS